MKLLHIDSSALGAHSVSRELSAAIVEAWKHGHPGTDVVYRDLAANPLPHWTPVSDASDPAVHAANEAMEQFLAADVIVIGTPMYNFGIPSSLKAWIDRIAVAGKTFRYGANGPEGLAGGKKIVIASSRGGFYGADSGRESYDFQEDYLRHVFGFLGVTDIDVVRAEGIGISPEQKAESIRNAHAEIQHHIRKAA